MSSPLRPYLAQPPVILRQLFKPKLGESPSLPWRLVSTRAYISVPGSSLPCSGHIGLLPTDLDPELGDQWWDSSVLETIWPSPLPCTVLLAVIFGVESGGREYARLAVLSGVLICCPMSGAGKWLSQESAFHINTKTQVQTPEPIF